MKKTNKGFSLVELIIVIAIMAILAGAIAPALIRYIDKSRRSNDVNSAKTIKTAIETALGNESIYEYLTDVSATDFCTISCKPGESIGSATDSQILIKNASTETKINGKTNDELKKLARDTIAANIGEKIPKLKFRKNPADKSKPKPNHFVGAISKSGTVYVFITTNTTLGGASFTTDSDVGAIGTADAEFQITPYICDEYQ